MITAIKRPITEIETSLLNRCNLFKNPRLPEQIGGQGCNQCNPYFVDIAL
jgi:hypothetical protein